MMRLFLLLVASFHYVSYGQDYSNLIDYIRKDLLHKKELVNISSSFDVIKSTHKIPFRISDMTEDIIRTNYVDSFYYANTELAIANKQLIARIKDSMHVLNIKLNKKCTEPESAVFPKVNQLDTCFTAFFSSQCDNLIYAEAIYNFGIVSGEYGYEFYGTAFCCLFILDKNGRMTKVYTGEIDCN